MGQTDKITAPELYMAISIFGTSAKWMPDIPRTRLGKISEIAVRDAAKTTGR